MTHLQSAKKLANLLSEEFDAVQIVVCRLTEDGGTETTAAGSGLWHARTGMLQDFLDRRSTEDLADSIADAALFLDDDEEA